MTRSIVETTSPNDFSDRFNSPLVTGLRCGPINPVQLTEIRTALAFTFYLLSCQNQLCCIYSLVPILFSLRYRDSLFYLQRTVSIRRATIRAGTAKRILEKIVPGGRSSAGFADLGRCVLRSLLAATGPALPRQIRPSRGER